jgi:beta propeller repeat protein
MCIKSKNTKLTYVAVFILFILVILLVGIVVTDRESVSNEPTAPPKLKENTSTSTGSISVSSYPTGTSIYLDGEYKGEAPQLLNNIEQGSHSVALKLAGYKDWSQDISIDANKMISISPTLVTLPILTETQITNDGSDQEDAAIYGDKVVWLDHRNNKEDSLYGDIYLYNISTHKETRITTSGSAMYPDIYGERIVWQDNRSGNDDIFDYDLSTCKETQITTDRSDQWSPDIYGDRIVWLDNRNGDYDYYDIYMYDISTHKETQITTYKSDKFNPGIFGDRIVWADNRNRINWANGTSDGNWDIYVYNLSTFKETQITTDQSCQNYPSIYGNRIIWVDSRNGDLERDIYMYDFSTHKESQITTNELDQDFPSIYGDKIVWLDDRHADYLFDRDIYMYDLSTSIEIRITIGGGSPGIPKIYGDRIVWEDSRNGSDDVYMCTIS